MEREVLVRAAQRCDEMIFEGANRPLGCVAAVAPWRHELVVNVLGGHELLKRFRALVVHALQFWPFIVTFGSVDRNASWPCRYKG